jgi:AcrR family transcriptional regulator
MTSWSGKEAKRSVRARKRADLIEEFRVGTIQEAALRVISRRGLTATSMQAVAAEAGIAKGTIYLYFKNREDLLERTGEWAMSQLKLQTEPLFAEPNGDPFPVRLRAMVETQIAFFHEHREFFRLFQDVVERKGEGECRRNHKHYVHYITALTAVLRRAMKRGEIRRADPERLALFLSEGVRAVIIHRLDEARSPAPAAEAEWIVDVLLRGISGKGGRA